MTAEYKKKKNENSQNPLMPFYKKCWLDEIKKNESQRDISGSYSSFSSLVVPHLWKGGFRQER